MSAKYFIRGLAAGLSPSEREEIITMIRSLPARAIDVESIKVDGLMGLTPEKLTLEQQFDVANGIIIKALEAIERHGVAPDDLDMIATQLAAGDPLLAADAIIEQRQGGVLDGDLKASATAGLPTLKPLSGPIAQRNLFAPVTLLDAQPAATATTHITNATSSQSDLAAMIEEVGKLKKAITERTAQVESAAKDAVQLLVEKSRLQLVTQILSAPADVVEHLTSVKANLNTMANADQWLRGIIKRQFSFVHGDPDSERAFLDRALGVVGHSISGVVKGTGKVISEAWEELTPGQKVGATAAGVAAGALAGRRFLAPMLWRRALTKGVSGSTQDGGDPREAEVERDEVGIVSPATVAPMVPVSTPARLAALGSYYRKRKDASKLFYGDPVGAVASALPLAADMPVPRVYVEDTGEIVFPSGDTEDELHGGRIRDIKDKYLAKVGKGLGSLTSAVGKGMQVVSTVSPVPIPFGKAIGKGLEATGKAVTKKAQSVEAQKNQSVEAQKNQAIAKDLLAKAGVDPKKAEVVAQQPQVSQPIARVVASSNPSQAIQSSESVKVTMTQVADADSDAAILEALASELEGDMERGGYAIVPMDAELEGAVPVAAVTAMRGVWAAIAHSRVYTVLARFFTQGGSYLWSKISKAVSKLAQLSFIKNGALQAFLLKWGSILGLGYILDRHFASKEKRSEVEGKLGTEGTRRLQELEAKVREKGVGSLTKEEQTEYAALISALPSDTDVAAVYLEADPEGSTSVEQLLRKYGPAALAIIGILAGPRLYRWFKRQLTGTSEPLRQIVIGDVEDRDILRGGLKLKVSPETKQKAVKVLKSATRAGVLALRDDSAKQSGPASGVKQSGPASGVQSGPASGVRLSRLGFPDNVVAAPRSNVSLNEKQAADLRKALDIAALEDAKVLDVKPKESLFLVASISRPGMRRWIKVYRRS